MDSSSIKNFIMNNKWSVLIGLFVYGLFLFFTFSGNRICDCVSTEKYSSNNNGRVGITRFYHK
ncbi:hypothetical protein CLV94_1472 [Flavobacterium endophyticum]|uniref:Uncharacterized protein n=1 Tax=Flavobacterium endophyticum TaxID=1540163 RepID=A0A495MKB8_9FLAO|nr:hypothetical protein CLV94_1472 [Flavobacterium endophyticum]